MSRPMVPEGGDDRVYTPRWLAKALVEHFKPDGHVLEPCRGDGAFTEALKLSPWPIGYSWMEIDEGSDFLKDRLPSAHFNWVFTNPPFSKLRPFLIRSLEISDNVMFLCNLNAMLGLRARVDAVQSAGFGFKEILFMDNPAKPWPQSGFQLGAVHMKVGWNGACTFSRL